MARPFYGLCYLGCAGILPLMRHITRKKIRILAYHNVIKDNPEDLGNFDGRNVEAANFERHMRYLRKHYNIVSITDYMEAVKSRVQLPYHSLIITFDDGYEGLFKYAYPILKKYDIPAAVFLVSDLVDSGEAGWYDKIEFSILNTTERYVKLDLGIDGLKRYDLNTPEDRTDSCVRIKEFLKRVDVSLRRKAVNELLGKLKVNLEDMPERYRMLSWPQIREMQDNYVLFGSHTVTHPILTNEDAAAIEKELKDSKYIMERKLGRQIHVLSYPNGDFNNIVKEIAADTGYSGALTCFYGVNNINSDMYELKRIVIANHFSEAFFLASLFPQLRRLALLLIKIKNQLVKRRKS